MDAETTMWGFPKEIKAQTVTKYTQAGCFRLTNIFFDVTPCDHSEHPSRFHGGEASLQSTNLCLQRQDCLQELALLEAENSGKHRTQP